MADPTALLGDLVWLVPALAAGGVVTGILAGLFGIGGGGIIVPVLYELFAIIGVDDAYRIQLALGTSLAIIIPTSFRSFLGHRARGAVDMAVFRRWIPWILVGTGIATVIAAYAPSDVLRTIYAVVMFLMGARMLAARDDWRLGDTMPGSPIEPVMATLTGLFAMLLGLSGGSYLTMVMVLYGRPIHQAVATAAGVGVVVSIPAVLGYMWGGWDATGLPVGSLGYVNFIACALVIPTSVLAAPVGVRLAHGLSRKTLERAFGVFMLAVALRFAASLVA
jgi:uncharacterized membrane protein YfcA